MKSNLQKIEPPHILPVPEGIYRPFWSVMVPSYNCSKYLCQTLESILSQDPGAEQMQIEVVDDCSTEDHVETIVKEIGKGRVSFYCQPKNVGSIKNFNTCVSRSIGKWVHILHGDDLVMPGFYAKYEQLINKFSEATLLTGPSYYIDENNFKLGTSEPMICEEGKVQDFPEKQAIRNFLATPSVVILRDVYVNIGGYCELLFHTADWEMFFRAGAYGEVISTLKPYSLYRIHTSSHTSNLIVTGSNIEQGLLAVNLCFGKLPIEKQYELKPKKFFWLSSQARHFSADLLKKDHFKGSLIQAYWALALQPNKSNFKVFIKTSFKYLFGLTKKIVILLAEIFPIQNKFIKYFFDSH